MSHLDAETPALLREQVSADQLLPLVYDELRKLAAANLAREQPGQTVQATALVHEAYLRLAGEHAFTDQRHFFRVAAEAMRRILIDRARLKGRIIHGGALERKSFAEIDLATETTDDRLLEIDEALKEFAVVDPAKAELVKLRYFAGLSEEETATALGISRATASRHWAYARAWLIAALEDSAK